MTAYRNHSSRPRTRLSVLALALLLHHQQLVLPQHRQSSPFNILVSAYTPFGYQSFSSNSPEYRNGNDDNENPNPNVADDPNNTPIDPSSYAGSIHYDPLHHALYLTGATYASGVFDGLDVFGLTTTEKEELLDGNPNNDGYWWEDMATGLKPHLEDVGVPGYSAKNGDCFYAVLGLPQVVDDDGGGDGGPDANPEDANEVKLVHSRRFGSEGSSEACSAVDMLFASPKQGATGGYMHEFQGMMQEDHDQVQFPPPSGLDDPFGPDGPPRPETNSPTFSSSNIPMTGAGEGIFPTMSPMAITMAPTTMSPTISNMPVMRPLGNTGPQSRFRALGEEEENGAVESTNENSITDNIAPDKKKSRPEQKRKQAQRRQQGGIPAVETRSARLLMAGHVESPTKRDGYVIEDLPSGHYDEVEVYAFAQQIDVRLPRGELGQIMEEEDIEELQVEEYDKLDYALHMASKTEDEMMNIISELGESWQLSLPQREFEQMVTSGVESRALLNDQVPDEMEAIYPVALVADPTTKKHYYVAMLASSKDNYNPKDENRYRNIDPTIGEGASQRIFTEYTFDDDWRVDRIDDLNANDHFGKRGRPNYGSRYRIIVKKMSIEANVEETELTDIEKKLAASSHEGDLIAMRQTWIEEYEPDLKEDARPSGLLFAPKGGENDEDVLVLVGTTAGRGSAFGTMSESLHDSITAKKEDLDGFVMKIRTVNGAFSGKEKFDLTTNSFRNSHSKRIKSQAGQGEIVAGVCAKPLTDVGVAEKTKFIYVVGSTSAILEGVQFIDRDEIYVSKYPPDQGMGGAMEAFLMKINLSTMMTVWTRQVGAFNKEGNMKGDVFGYGCAVTGDGEDVYLTGLVKEYGVATDWSSTDYFGVEYKAEGGSDVFISSYKTQTGSRNFLKQVGSTKDDFPSRGNGGITTDRYGNAILTGNTRGSMMRSRDGAEFRYGESGNDAASDVFIMSFERATGSHLPITSDGAATVPAPITERPTMPLPTPVTSSPPVAAPALDVIASPVNKDEVAAQKTSALVGVVTISLALLLMVSGAYFTVVHRNKTKKRRENQVLMENGNLHGDDGGTRNSKLPGRRTSAWGANRKNSALNDFGDLNIMVEVRNSASGGWHGVYDDEQLQAIDFGVPSDTTNNTGTENVVEESLFMEDGLQEIEDSLHNYEIGDMDVSDEDLIKAYNDAMALDIEPESPDVEFAMAGLEGGDMPDAEELAMAALESGDMTDVEESAILGSVPVPDGRGRQID